MTLEPAVRCLVEAVQHNCHVADARHAADLPLCIYLLQMREFYRWEQRLAFGEPLSREAVGAWLAEREGLWAALEAQPFAPLPCGDAAVDAFDAATVNAWLAPAGLVYGAGLVGPGRPAFFVAHLESAGRREFDGHTLALQVCGDEQARGLQAPPAVLAGGDTIVLRRESLARWLWETFESHGPRPAATRHGSFQRFARAWQLSDAASFRRALPRLLVDLGELLIQHEFGEFNAGRRLDPGWAALRGALKDDRRSELRLRAVRDLLADLAVTLPGLLRDGEAGARMHFWFATYEGHREALFPSLKSAYADWCAGDGGRALERAIDRGQGHFTALADELLALHALHGEAAAPRVAERLNAASAVCPG
jgi:hypothetical protein